MKTRVLILSIAGLCVLASSVWADTEDSLQTILNKMTVGGVSSVNVATEALDDDLDSWWETAATGNGTATFIIEIAGDALYNSVGIYDPTGTGGADDLLPLFSGTATTGWRAVIFVDDKAFDVYMFNDSGTCVSGTSATYGSTLFGFYLQKVDKDTGAVTATFYSDSSLNNGDDQMLALRGENDQVDRKYSLRPGGVADLEYAGLWTPEEYVLAWEDKAVSSWGSDSGEPDYNDLVMLVESVVPVPVPAAVLLGMLGLGAAGIRLRKHV